MPKSQGRKKVKFYFEKLAILFLVTFCLLSCVSDSQNTKLIRIEKTSSTNVESKYGYINQRGDTIVPLGKYAYCFRDTIKDFGVVVENQTGNLLAIDLQGSVMYEVFKYDNGPDYLREDLFRIIQDDKIGFANIKGEIIIEARYECAFPFENGQAKVALICSEVKEGEHTTWESDEWIYINKEGKQI